jgi:hypothetical protein
MKMVDLNKGNPNPHEKDKNKSRKKGSEKESDDESLGEERVQDQGNHCEKGQGDRQKVTRKK